MQFYNNTLVIIIIQKGPVSLFHHLYGVLAIVCYHLMERDQQLNCSGQILWPARPFWTVVAMLRIL